MTDPDGIGPYPTDVPTIRGLIHQFVGILPVATDLDGLADFMFGGPAQASFHLKLARAFGTVTLVERLVLASFVRRYGCPATAPTDSLARRQEQERADRAFADLKARAEDTITIYVLAEQLVLCTSLGDPQAIDRLGRVMIKGQPEQIGTWISYLVLRDLIGSLGEGHYLITTADSILRHRDLRAA